MRSSKDTYNIRRLKYEKLIKKQKETINFVSILRLIDFATFASFSVYFFFVRRYSYVYGVFLVGLAIFIYLVVKHGRLIKNKSLSEAILNINNISIKRIAGEWKDFTDDGRDFINTEHNFTYDLDVFGPSSLFQWINCANTYFGRIFLKERLSNPTLRISIIKDTQEAVSELGRIVNWRQRLAAEGSFILTEDKKVLDLISWAKVRNDFLSSAYLRVITIIMPVFTMTSIISYLFLHLISYIIPLICICINLCIYKIYSKQRAEGLDTIFKHKKSLNMYYNMVRHVEKRKFNSSLLRNLQSKFVIGKFKTSDEINKLMNISNKISDRSNFFTIIINIIFLWDFHLLKLLENWKSLNGDKVEEWLQTLGEFEALSSLSQIGFDNQHWEYPELIDGLLLQAENTAHPLIYSDAVSNSINIDKDSSIILITGSNMSGKSTFLRTLGINLVLAYAGTKVCASTFKCGIMNIYSCMRINDNLEKNISSFYAEIIKIKNIVSAVNRDEVTFFLLDEIFKGTNSLDRHMGAEALMTMLSKNSAIGLISTHDLELADLELKNTKVKNYHFQEYYLNNEIHFDYKLRSGVSTTRNAKFLMKLAGIEF